MRKLKLQVQISIDGYIAGTKGEMEWLVWQWDDALKEYIGVLTEPVDCIVLGRKLAQSFLSYWTNAFNNPKGAEEGAKKLVETPKIVFTKTLKKSEWNNTKLATGDLVEEITELKKQNGGDIITYGGASFVSSLIRHGLIDEFNLLINPTAMGTGMPIFQELKSKQNLTLVKAKQFDCGIAVLQYQHKLN